MSEGLDPTIGFTDREACTRFRFAVAGPQPRTAVAGCGLSCVGGERCVAQSPEVEGVLDWTPAQ